MPKKLRKKTPRVAVLLESSHEVSRSMIRGILKYIRLYGPWGIDIVSGGALDQRLPDRRYWKGDGIIGRVPSRQVANEILEANLPTVVIDPIDEFLDPRHRFSGFPSVRCDSDAVGRFAAEYLMNGAFEHFAFVGEISGINWSRYRRESFCSQLALFGYFCHVYPLPAETKRDWNIERRHMMRWLRRLPKPIALFAANDQRARQVLDACFSASVPVPYQVAVLGVNNDQLVCETTLPPLSSIVLDSEQGGFAAAKMLDQWMRGIKPNPDIVHFGPREVVSRESSEPIHVNNKMVVKALEFIRANAGANIRVSDVAHHLGVSRQWAEKSFKRELGHSIIEEIQEVRMRTIRSLVAHTHLPFQEIAHQCGFECANHLGIIFKKTFGITMSDYRALNPPDH